MSVGPAAGADAPAGKLPGMRSRMAHAVLMLLPGALVVWMGLRSGGYFPDGTALLTVALLLALAARIGLVERPTAGLGPRLVPCVAALATLFVLALVSIAWSHAPARGLVQADRTLAYLLVLVLLAGVPRRTDSMTWVARGLAAAFALLCLVGLATRLLPHVFPYPESFVPERLGYPLTYWNAMALAAGIGLVLTVHLACTETERRAAGAFAALVPALSATLLLTYSRAGIALAAAGVLAYLIAARPRTALATAVAVLPPAGVAVGASYLLNAVSSSEPTSSQAVSEGWVLALVVVGCMAWAGLSRATFAERIAPFAPGPRARRACLALGAAVVLAGIGVLATRAEWTPTSDAGGSDVRSRLGDVSPSARDEYWRAAVRGFRDSPLYGQGAGTFAVWWSAHRDSPLRVTHAHSLYLETLAELGVLGLVALLAVLAALVAAVARLPGESRALRSALLVAIGVWCVHAALDWDWQVPAVTLWLFAVGGGALALPATAARSWRPGLGVRVPASLAPLALAVVPALLASSEFQLNRALHAYERGDCATAARSADSAYERFPLRPQPEAVLALCRARAGDAAAARRAIDRAIFLDPRNWEYRYARAVVVASTGRVPRPDLRAARRLNPLEPTVVSANRVSTGWAEWASGTPLRIDGLEYPPLGAAAP